MRFDGTNRYTADDRNSPTHRSTNTHAIRCLLASHCPQDRVNSRTMAGARLRRHVLRGAVVVFVTAGYSSKRFIFEKAKELGVRSVVIDGPDSWSKVGAGLCGAGLFCPGSAQEPGASQSNGCSAGWLAVSIIFASSACPPLPTY